MRTRPNNRNNRRFKRGGKPNHGNDSAKDTLIIPSPGILESYEEIAPGSAGKIVDMAKLEQEHRHKWENNYLKAMAYTARVGQLLSFALAIIIVYTCLIFAKDESYGLAIVVAIMGFAFLAAATFASSNSKKHIHRPKRDA